MRDFLDRRRQWLIAMAGVWILLSMDSFAQEQNGPPPPPPHGANPQGSTTGFDGARTGVTEARSEAQGMRPQISVKGSDPYINASFREAAFGVRDSFRRLFLMPPRIWNINIRIKLQGKPSDIIEGRDLATQISLRPDDFFELTLHARLHERFSEDKFEREMLRVLVLEQMLQPYVKDPDSLTAKNIAVPEWLIIGLHQQLSFQENGARSSYFAGILESGNVMTVRSIVEQENPAALDSMSRAVFESSAAALVSTLLSLPEGPANLTEMIQDYTTDPISSTGGDPVAKLRAHFPELRETKMALGKWWTLQVAALSEKTAFEYYSLGETQDLLDDALKVVFGADLEDPIEPRKRGVLNKWLPKLIGGGKKDLEEGKVETFPIENFKAYIDHPHLLEALERNQLLIREVKHRGFPVYRDLAERYLFVIEGLQNDKKIGLSDEMIALRKLRASIDSTMERVTDYINYFEATQAPAKSEAFEDYRAMRRQLEKARPPSGNDRISKHLDDLEKLFD